MRYQGVDWRDPANWGCNLEHNPYGEHYLDGGSLEAMEVVFVKVKQRLLDSGWAYSLQATLFDQWRSASDMVRLPPHLHLFPPAVETIGIDLEKRIYLTRRGN